MSVLVTNAVLFDLRETRIFVRFQVKEAQDGQTDKMDSTTPIFGLDPAINVLDWLFALESRIRRLGVPEDENIFIAGDFTKISAFHMAKRKMMNGNRNCENNRP